MTLLQKYTQSKSETIAAAKNLGTKERGRGVNFFDGDPRGPWNAQYEGTTDVWQNEFLENKKGTNVTPAATNDGKYPLSRWRPKSLKIAFGGEGPVRRPAGYWLDNRFNTFKDSAGRWTEEGSKLHKYAPLKDKTFGELDGVAKTRIASSPTSTSVRGLNG